MDLEEDASDLIVARAIGTAVTLLDEQSLAEAASTPVEAEIDPTIPNFSPKVEEKTPDSLDKESAAVISPPGAAKYVDICLIHIGSDLLRTVAGEINQNN